MYIPTHACEHEETSYYRYLLSVNLYKTKYFYFSYTLENCLLSKFIISYVYIHTCAPTYANTCCINTK